MLLRPVFSDFLRMSTSRTSTYYWLQRRSTIPISLQPYVGEPCRYVDKSRVAHRISQQWD
jgi:hypothetical protein